MKLELDQDIAGILEPERAFDRRDFLSTALGASAALAASGTSAQQIVTDTAGLNGGRRDDQGRRRNNTRLFRDARNGRPVCR